MNTWFNTARHAIFIFIHKEVIAKLLGARASSPACNMIIASCKHALLNLLWNMRAFARIFHLLHAGEDARAPRRFVITSLVFFIAGLSAGAFQSAAFAGEVDSLRWHFEGQRQMRDGSVEAHFSLYGADALNIEELEFFYTAGSLNRGKNPDVQPERRTTAYYKKVPAETRNLVIYSGRYMQLELMAVAKAGGITYVTQTTVSLYGQSGIDKTDFEEIDALPALTGLDIHRRGRYGVMTGEPIDFSMRNGYAGPVRIYLDGEKIVELLPEDGIYSYILPGGRKLATRARSDYHELLFAADEFEAEGFDGVIQFSCWLPMYRSARDNQDFPGGFATLFSAAAISAVAVVLKGRRFKWR